MSVHNNRFNTSESDTPAEDEIVNRIEHFSRACEHNTVEQYIEEKMIDKNSRKGEYKKFYRSLVAQHLHEQTEGWDKNLSEKERIDIIDGLLDMYVEKAVDEVRDRQTIEDDYDNIERILKNVFIGSAANQLIDRSIDKISDVDSSVTEQISDVAGDLGDTITRALIGF